MATLATALARGLRADQPVATDVPNGNLYFVTDEGVTEQSDGSAWVSYSGAGGSGTVTHTGALTASRVVVGNGTDDLKVLGSLGTTTTVLHGNAAGLPTFAAVALATDVSGVLPIVNGGTGSTAGAGILTVSVTLTDAQVKALPTTPVTILAAPAVTYRNRLMAASLILRGSAGAYTNLNTTYLLCALATPLSPPITAPLLNDTSTDPSVVRASEFFGVAHNAIYDFALPGQESYINDVPAGITQWVLPVQSADVSAWEAQTVALQVDNNGSGNFTGGNAANSLIVTAYYVVEYCGTAL